MKFLLFHDDVNDVASDSDVDAEMIKKLEDIFENAENIYQSLRQLDPYHYSYIYLRMKHQIEDEEEVLNKKDLISELIEKALYYE